LVLIFSVENDLSTTQVIKWLKFNKCKFIRINDNDIIEILYIKLDGDFEFEIEIKTYNSMVRVNSKNIEFVWYRRGVFSTRSSLIKTDKIKLRSEINSINNYILAENYSAWKTIEDYMYSNIPHLNKPRDTIANKITMLRIAQNNGFVIPKSIVSTTQSNIKEFVNDNNSITKPISQGWIDRKESDISIDLLTEKLELEITNDLEANVNATLVQELVDKRYELRVFHLMGCNFASCIFSQNDDQTKVDFRNYNFKRNNRVVPYTLGKSIEIKINKFMLDMNINCGSLDIIINTDGEAIFLEVNPVGQFSQVSKPCNYNLELLIAKEILKYVKN